jgi:hypothetical protein
VRLTLSVVAGAVVAALSALIVGEYPFQGALALVSGAVMGLVVAEVMAAVGRRRHLVVAVPGALFAAGSVLWAAWIASGQGLEPYPPEAWVAAALGLGVAGFRLRPRGAAGGGEPTDSPLTPESSGT